MITLNTLSSILTEWWPFKLPFNIMMFLTSVALAFAPTTFWLNSTLLLLINVIIFLHCFAKAMNYVVDIGKMIDLRDSDLKCMTTDMAHNLQRYGNAEGVTDGQNQVLIDSNRIDT